MNINVHIERLVLHGLSVPHHQHPQLQVAVETELARLLAADGLGPGLQVGGARPFAPAGEIQLSSGDNALHLGEQIAQAVHGGIGS